MHPKILRLQIRPAIKGYEANLQSLELVDFKNLFLSSGDAVWLFHVLDVGA